MAAIATKVHSFAVTLAGPSELTPAMADAIFAAGCDDATPSSRGGVVRVGFDREAADLAEAVASAIRDVERAGYAVARVDVEPAEG